jgi:hypothetical protein
MIKVQKIGEKNISTESKKSILKPKQAHTKKKPVLCLLDNK